MPEPYGTEQGRRVAEMWRDPAFVGEWAEGDAFGDLLAVPRRIAAAIVAHDRPEPRLVVDVASGPGAFLAVFLEEFPGARGVWSDASEAMLARARENLAPYGDRVEFRLADMTDLAGGGLPGDADAIITSRAVHHLDREGLRAFHAEAASMLAPGGWLVNLDHVGPPEVWDRRMRAVRPRFVRPRPKDSKHHHTYPLAGLPDHLDAYFAAGFTDVEVVWRAFYTCLFMGRKDG